MLNLLDSIKVDLGEGAFYAVFGFVFVFVGITILIAIFLLLGYLMKRLNERKGEHAEERQSAVSSMPEAEEGIPPETIAVIAAALAAYYEAAPQKCDFVVRRIKRL